MLRADVRMVKLLVYSGYDVNSETWLHLKTPPFKMGSHDDVLKWLLELFMTPKSLKDICILTIRQQLGRRLRNVQEVNLPERLKKLILFDFLR